MKELFAALASCLAGQIALEGPLIVAGDPAYEDFFGAAIDVSGDTLVVGAWGDDQGASDLGGSVYVFERSGTTWVERQKLVASDAGGEDHFGVSVAVSGDTIAVGANGHDGNGTDAGAVYVFTRAGTVWSETARLVGSGTSAYDGFGLHVAAEGDTIVVGARFDDHAGPVDAGAAYVFAGAGSSWSEEACLVAGDPGSKDYFGSTVALSADTIAVGAQSDNVGGVQSAGSAYVFVRSGTAWTEQQKLTASDPGPSDWFGVGLDVEGDTLVVGANMDDHAGGVNAGSAYVFERSGTSWSQSQKLVASTVADDHRFAYSVALEGDRLALGTIWYGPPLNAGAAYSYGYDGTSWKEEVLLVSSNAQNADVYGYGVALQGDTVLVGGPRDSHSGVTFAGSVLEFRIAPGPAVSYCTAGTSASGCRASLSADGAASAGAPSGFLVQAASVEGARDGLFFFGAGGRQANPWGNGSSLNCVVPPVTRAGLLNGTGTPAACDGAFAQDLNALWCPACPRPAKNPGAGAVVQLQLWYRDPSNTSNQSTSLSDALEFCVGL